MHTSKDLAVSPYMLPYKLFPGKILGIPPLSLWTSLLAPLVSRPTGVTRYLAPWKIHGCVRTFLSTFYNRAIIVSLNYTIIQEKRNLLRDDHFVSNFNTLLGYKSGWSFNNVPSGFWRSEGLGVTLWCGIFF